MYCSACGRHLESSAKFCNGCGCAISVIEVSRSKKRLTIPIVMIVVIFCTAVAFVGKLVVDGASGQSAVTIATTEHERVHAQVQPASTASSSTTAADRLVSEQEEKEIYYGSPKSKLPLLKQAVKLARKNFHCTKATAAIYYVVSSASEHPEPFCVTCVVNNPRIATWPYANYFYTEGQIRKGVIIPHSTLGDVP